jgi:hypothetical protein
MASKVNSHIIQTQASPYVRRHYFKKNGKSFKSHQRPRYPWYEMFWMGNELHISMWRQFGGNPIEVSAHELPRFIEMLQAAQKANPELTEYRKTDNTKNMRGTASEPRPRDGLRENKKQRRANA